MEAFEIIRHFNKDPWGHGYWEHIRGIDYKQFNKLLGGDHAALTSWQYSRMRSGDLRMPSLQEALRLPELVERMEAELACPGLFSCKTTGEVDALIGSLAFRSQSADAGSPMVGALLIPDLAELDAMHICAKETLIAKRLMSFVERKGDILGAWTELPPLGASLIAYVTAGRRMQAGSAANYLIRPFINDSAAYLASDKLEHPPEVPFHNGLQDLKRELGLVEDATAWQILDKLVENGSTLFVLNADILQTRKDRLGAMQTLLSCAESRPSRTTKCLPIMLMGSPGRDPRISQNWTFEGGSKLEFGPDAERERDEFFETQWRRFCRLRDIELGAEAGSSRLKRVRRYYSSDTKSSSWPSTVRVQAFFASNHRTFGYFDPTAGWTALAGMAVEELPLDVRLHLDEAVLQLRSIREGGKRNPAPRVVQWCSTAVYWLTADAVAELGKDSGMLLSTFDAAIEGLKNGLVEVHREDDQVVYKMDLGMRAVIQDRWMNKEPLARAKAHHQVALRLYSRSDDKTLLGLEFPIQPHWGRSRLHFLAEAIRHLVRSSDRKFELAKPAFTDEGAEPFPRAPGVPVTSSSEGAPPTLPIRGCNPYEVINFCFGKLFLRELNGHGRRSTHQLNRKLSLQHGAYHLTAELLQLMSQDGQLGIPHRALNPVYVHRYLREVAFSQLDLGDLKGARATLEDLIARAKSDEKSSFDVIDYLLDLTVVLASMDDLSEAKGVLQEASRHLDSLQPLRATPNAHVGQLLTRIRARQAHLSYLEGRFEDALEQCQHIERESPATLVRDAAHTYISTLGSLTNDPRNLELATRICLRQLFDNTSRGLHHEALGFRVALGHIFRKMKFLGAAEEALDGAYSDIIQYGCSERTYIAMLLEAGRILFYQGRYARAYAAYLRPCWNRAKSRGYARPARHAGDYAQRCLKELLARVPEAGWDETVMKAQLEAYGDYFQSKRTERLVDPLHSYDPTEVERWWRKLQTREKLEEELASLSQL